MGKRLARPARAHGAGQDSARAAALMLVDAVLDRGALLDQAASGAGSPLAALDGPDRAAALRIARQTLRHWDRAGSLLAPLLRKPPPRRIDRLLRLATVELCGEGGAAHGVVNAAVGLARADQRSAALAGLVNAVLRRVAVNGAAAWADLPPQRLAPALRDPLVESYGTEAVRAIEAVHAEVPPLDLTPRDGDPVRLAARVGGQVLPTGSVRLTARRQVSDLPSYDDGAFWVQDAAAAIPARLVGARPGMRALDLCAAPGGKTLQMAAAGAAVTALDISPPRLARLRENLDRTGLAADLIAADALDWPGATFDAILLDAPCTATGTIRRHPDLPFRNVTAELGALSALQAALIDRALTWLQPGGRLVYCCCSLLSAEGEDQADAALRRHPALAVDASAFASPWIEERWLAPQGLRLRPDHWSASGGLDGFFITVFRRHGEGGPAAGPG